MLRKLSNKNDKNEELHIDNGCNFINDILDNNNNGIINNNLVKENKNIIKLKKIKDNKKECKDKSDKFRDVINVKSLTNAEDNQYNNSAC
jgi:hypothetical protein